MSESASYILHWTETKFWLAGPFNDAGAASDYGRSWGAQNGDDPRWQGISLTDVPAGVEVVAP